MLDHANVGPCKPLIHAIWSWLDHKASSSEVFSIAVLHILRILRNGIPGGSLKTQKRWPLGHMWTICIIEKKLTARFRVSLDSGCSKQSNIHRSVRIYVFFNSSLLYALVIAKQNFQNDATTTSASSCYNDAMTTAVFIYLATMSQQRQSSATLQRRHDNVSLHLSYNNAMTTSVLIYLLMTSRQRQSSTTLHRRNDNVSLHLCNNDAMITSVFIYLATTSRQRQSSASLHRQWHRQSTSTFQWHKT